MKALVEPREICLTENAGFLLCKFNNKMVANIGIYDENQ